MSVCSPVSASISSPRLLLNVLKDVTYAQSAPGHVRSSAQVCSKNNLRTLPPSDRDSDTECNTRGGGEEVAEDMCYGILRA